MMDVLTVQFIVTRSATGGYFAECPELGARVNGSTLAALETRLIEFAAWLLDGSSIARRGATARRHRPTIANLGFNADLTKAYVELITGIRSGALTFEGGHRRVEPRTSLDEVFRSRITP